MSTASRSWFPLTAPRGSNATAATEPRPARLRLNGGTMKLIPHHQDDKYGPREYRSPDGTWRVVRTPRDDGRQNDRSRWEVHERHEDRVGGWHHHAAFERRRDALTAPPKRRKTPELSQEPSQSSPRRRRRGRLPRPSRPPAPRPAGTRALRRHSGAAAGRPPPRRNRTSIRRRATETPYLTV